MSISALNSGLSGLQSYQTALDSSAHNIANANTNGFIPEQANFQESGNGGVTVNISRQGSAAASAASATDLTTETVNAIQYKAGFDLNAQVVKTANEVLGTLINIQA
jgi:flagellar hook protein FlgE